MKYILPYLRPYRRQTALAMVLVAFATVCDLLLVFSTLCGIGIKTTLGMGGVTLEISPNSLLKEQEK